MSPTPRPAVPIPLLGAAVTTVAEGVFMLGYAVLELVHFHPDRAVAGVTTAAFFAILGGGLIAGGWMVAHGNPRARSPIVVAQVIFLGVAWSFRGGSTTTAAVVIAVVALVVLVGLLHPASTAALTEDG